MSARISTPMGHAVPPALPHSVTFHIPTWANAVKFGVDPRPMLAAIQNVYPRIKPHRDIASLSRAVLERLDFKDKLCLLFSSLQSATECVEFATSPRRDNGIDKKPLQPASIEIRVFEAKDRFYAVIFPAGGMSIVGSFWATPGVGMSSRFAENNLKSIDKLTQVDISEDSTSREIFETSAHDVVRERILSLLDRAALRPDIQPRAAMSDIYFFPTGMASIYKPHTYLSSLYNGTTVLFGMAFANTIAAFQDFGAGSKFFGLGTDADIRALEDYLEEERQAGRKVQAIWTEFPANPILVTPDLIRLRALADKYDVVLAVDDTIGSFASVDVLHISDLVVTSLTKSFNGYADVIAGCTILNPASRLYGELKSVFNEHYVPELYFGDAETIERNSRDYLARSTKMNHNASSLVNYLQSQAENGESAVSQVHYPTVNPSGKNYKAFMRPATDDFTPGYGCLFSVEFEDIATTTAFYDALNVHNSPHLGAPSTLALPYVMCLYGTKTEWAAQYGLRPTQIRISAGLEDTDMLIEDFRIAVEAADRVKRQRAVESIEQSG